MTIWRTSVALKVISPASATTVDTTSALPRLLLQRVGEEQQQCDAERDDRQRLDESDTDEHQSQQAASSLRLPSRALDGTARHETVADARAECAQAEHQARGHGGQAQDQSPIGQGSFLRVGR